MSRTTADRKDFEVKLRITADTKKYLDERTKKGSITVSEYIRKLIEKDRNEFRIKRIKEFRNL